VVFVAKSLKTKTPKGFRTH